jgi:O-methyltransferase
MTIRSVARWAFVNAAGRLPDYSLAFSKVAYWIRFSKWYMATGAKISKFDVSTGEESGRKAMYERMVAKENLGQAAISYLEFGVHLGGSFFWWSTRCPDPRNRVVGFDTFLGLPEDWSPSSRKGKFSTDGQIPKTHDSRCCFEVGLFQSTLRGFLTRFDRNGTRWCCI